ncbi:MAG: bifunctional adenosylcobinamide kinase/adenosylcobinamide-phosphate guanylyltransferase [Muribaculaceae bacterium]|nr:bifunctional adenosylcobinamide kinase/adenosylcobinamide-phosphate guanylyltransferase [Muribaculaceae bacterium]
MITLITGGQRSGKSEMAERLALESDPHPVYLATSTIPEGDADWADRVRAHQARRGEAWTTVEEPCCMSRQAANLEGRTVLLDCLTLLATNHFFDCKECVEAAYKSLVCDMEVLARCTRNLIIVTNEIGLGGISANAMQRRFADLQGLINRHVAEMADEVIFMISGIPLKIK